MDHSDWFNEFMIEQPKLLMKNTQISINLTINSMIHLQK